MDSILATGRVIHGYLGIEQLPLTFQAAKQRGLTDKTGVLVDRVRGGSPAEKADIHPGDLIQKFNGKAVTNINDLRSGVDEIGVNAVATIELLREGKPLNVQAQIAERPPDARISSVPNGPGSRHGAMPGAGGSALEGVAVVELTPTVLTRRGLPDDTAGVLVETVDAASPAADKLRPGDIIDGINHQEVVTLIDYATRSGEMLGGEPALLSVLRSQTHLLVVINPG